MKVISLNMKFWLIFSIIGISSASAMPSINDVIKGVLDVMTSMINGAKYLMQVWKTGGILDIFTNFMPSTSGTSDSNIGNNPGASSASAPPVPPVSSGSSSTSAAVPSQAPSVAPTPAAAPAPAAG